MKPLPRPREAPPGAPLYVELFRVPDKEQCIVRFLESPRGILTHWKGKESVACGGPGRCPAALHNGKTVWKSYAPAHRWRAGQYQDWVPCVFEVTERLYELLQHYELVGAQWRCWREIGRTRNREVIGEEIQAAPATCEFKSFGVESVVCRIFRTTEIQWDVPPMMPARTLVEPIIAAPPPKILLPTPTPLDPAAAAADREATRRLLEERRRRLSADKPAAQGER